MSLLLDALRKSEDRRRMGRPPGLDLPGTPGLYGSDRRPRRRRLLWLAPLALVLIVAAAVGLWWTAGDPDAVPPTTAGSPPAAGSPEVHQPLAVEPAPTAQQAEPAPAVAQRPVEPPTPAPDPVAPAPIPDPVPEPVAEPEPEPAIAAVPEPEPVPAGPIEPAAEPAPEPGPDRGAPEYVRRWELPLAIRQDLPSLNLSVHVWAQRPEDRFVLINGERWGEGDELASGLRLHEIRREGAVLDYRNYRFLLE